MLTYDWTKNGGQVRIVGLYFFFLIPIFRWTVFVAPKIRAKRQIFFDVIQIEAHHTCLAFAVPSAPGIFTGARQNNRLSLLNSAQGAEPRLVRDFLFGPCRHSIESRCGAQHHILNCPTSEFQ